jgi:hypothetical protein
MQVPFIHLNGTSRKSLLEGYEEASQSLELAYSALKQTVPHGRDYYPKGDGALKIAIEEHSSRLKRLDAIKGEIDALIGAICYHELF